MTYDGYSEWKSRHSRVALDFDIREESSFFHCQGWDLP